jgi:hypothetical protein
MGIILALWDQKNFAARTKFFLSEKGENINRYIKNLNSYEWE